MTFLVFVCPVCVRCRCRRRFFFGKYDVPGNLYALCLCDALPQALFLFGKNDVPGICMPCVCVMHCRKRFFFGKNDVPGICMPCVCVMHCRRRFFFGKNDVPGDFMPCVCVMHCRRLFFFGKKIRSWYFYALCVCDALPQALFLFGKNDVPGIFMPCVCDALVFFSAVPSNSVFFWCESFRTCPKKHLSQYHSILVQTWYGGAGWALRREGD